MAVPGHDSISQSQSTGVLWRGCGFGLFSRSGTSHPVVSSFAPVTFEAAGGFDKTLYAAEDVVLSRKLRHLGRFVILREEVVTSGRNLRSHSVFEAVRMMVGFALRGLGFFRTRHGPWYGRLP